MTEVDQVKIAVGDKVRVHFHPPNPLKSFSEGVVRRVDVATPQGRVFVVEVAHEVLLDREHRIRPGFQDHVRYDCRNDFPGRIEVLSATEQALEEPAPALMLIEEPADEPKQEALEQLSLEEDVQSEAEVELPSNTETNSEPSQADLEHPEPRRRGGLIGRLFERQK
jgi:hypothetical protein